MAESLLPFQCNHVDVEGLWKNTNTKTKKRESGDGQKKEKEKKKKEEEGEKESVVSPQSSRFL